MKAMNINFFLISFLMLGIAVGMSSCEKEEKSGYKTENLKGTFVGNHKLEISEMILAGLANSLPADPETGEKPDLTKGFNDTLELSVQGDVVKMYSRLLGITVDGEIVADNAFAIEETSYDVLRLGPLVEAKGASIDTASPIHSDFGYTGTGLGVTIVLKVNSVANLC